MICLTCGTHIPDGSVRCPACHASVGTTAPMPVVHGRWCPACGSAASWTDQVCPVCGMPLEEEWNAPKVETDDLLDVTRVEALEDQPTVDEAAETKAMPRIESAIPAEDDPESKVATLEVMPRVSRFMLASIASIALVCGLALLLTHPWNPNANSIKATKEADTSMAGFPGTVEELSGQDNAGKPQEDDLEGDDAVFAELDDIYEKLGRYAQRADESEASFADQAFDADAEVREAGKRTIEALAIDVNNLIEDLDQLDVSSGLYEEDRDHLLTLAKWLTYRVDTIRSAWRAAADSEDPSSEQEQLIILLKADAGDDGTSRYASLFTEHYEEWKPEHKDAEE